MTARQAARILEKVQSSRGVAKRQHFLDRLDEYGFDILDAYRILETGRMSRPRWDGVHENWTVRLVGRTPDGEDAAVVLAISTAPERVFFVTIEDLR